MIGFLALLLTLTPSKAAKAITCFVKTMIIEAFHGFLFF